MYCTNVWNNDQGWPYIRDCRVCLLCHEWSKAENLDLIRSHGRLRAQWQTEGLYLAVQVCTCMDMDCCPGNLTTKTQELSPEGRGLQLSVLDSHGPHCTTASSEKPVVSLADLRWINKMCWMLHLWPDVTVQLGMILFMETQNFY